MRFHFCIIVRGYANSGVPSGCFRETGNTSEAIQFAKIALLKGLFCYKIALHEVQFCSNLDVWVCVLNFACEKVCVSLRHYLMKANHC